MVGVAGVGGVPGLLEDAPAVGEHMRGAVDPVPVDRPLEGLQRAADRAGRPARAGDPEVVELGLRRHPQDVGGAHIAVLAPAGGLGSPIRGPAADHPGDAAVGFAVLHRAALRRDPAVEHADHDPRPAEALGPDLVDAEVAGHIGDRAFGHARLAVARADRTGGHRRCRFDDLDDRRRQVGERGDRRVAPDFDNIGAGAQRLHILLVLDCAANDVGLVFGGAGGEALRLAAHGDRLEFLIDLEAGQLHLLRQMHGEAR